MENLKRNKNDYYFDFNGSPVVIKHYPLEARAIDEKMVAFERQRSILATMKDAMLDGIELRTKSALLIAERDTNPEKTADSVIKDKEREINKANIYYKNELSALNQKQDEYLESLHETPLGALYLYIKENGINDIPSTTSLAEELTIRFNKFIENKLPDTKKTNDLYEAMIARADINTHLQKESGDSDEIKKMLAIDLTVSELAGIVEGGKSIEEALMGIYEPLKAYVETLLLIKLRSNWYEACKAVLKSAIENGVEPEYPKYLDHGLC